VQVFARTIVCEDLPTAAQYTRSHGLNAVTVEGDRADRKGALTGGFHDVRRSRLDTVKGVKRWREEHETGSARLNEVKAGITRLEQQISQAMGEIQRIEAKRKQIYDQRATLSAQAQWTAREDASARQRLSRLENDLAEAEGELRDAAAKRTSHEAELRTPMTQQLSNAEIRSLDSLTGEAETLKQALLDATQARQNAASERNHLDIELSENLRRRRDELRDRLDDLEGDAGSGVLQAGEVDLRNSELRNLIRSIEQISNQVQGQQPVDLNLESN